MSLISKIISENVYANVATVSEDGQPWNSPVFFAQKDKYIYWFSGQNSTHSKNIANNPRVFITVYDSTAPEGEGKGIYIKAEAHCAEDSEVQNGLDIYNSRAKRFNPTIQQVSGDAPTRLYVAEMKDIWTNAEGQENGEYVDVRSKLK